MRVTDFNGDSVLLDINGKPIIKSNPDYHNNIISCIEPINDKLIVQNAISLNVLIMDNKKQVKKSKKCNIL
jgi:hypothetical protein